MARNRTLLYTGLTKSFVLNSRHKERLTEAKRGITYIQHLFLSEFHIKFKLVGSSGHLLIGRIFACGNLQKDCRLRTSTAHPIPFVIGHCGIRLKAHSSGLMKEENIETSLYLFHHTFLFYVASLFPSLTQ
ncbi:hypothetical protein PoB_004956800 [Plakobranchus ocellatus]|uniref:Uncharacterized protein n=1 Tax=Plakobranchus ocellatus TaxID=259542 RepID=A0AAV4BTX3_9GAST|nr:hypothetical protein PoB_004956800 [Plakobranchus ocellatus]